MLNESVSSFLALTLTVILVAHSAPDRDASDLLVTCGERVRNISGQEVVIGFEDGRKWPLVDRVDHWEVYYVCTSSDGLDALSLSELNDNYNRSSVGHGRLSGEMMTGLIVGAATVLIIVFALFLISCLRKKVHQKRRDSKRDLKNGKSN
jgi:hypothetical protein